MHEDPRGRAARLSLPVHIHALDGGCRGLFGVGIGENHNRILAAEFQADALEIGRRRFGGGSAGRYRSDEADAVPVLPLRNDRGAEHRAFRRLLKRRIEILEREFGVDDLLEWESFAIRHDEIERLDQVARMIIVNAARL